MKIVAKTLFVLAMFGPTVALAQAVPPTQQTQFDQKATLDLCERQLSETHNSCDRNLRELVLEVNRGQQLAAKYSSDAAKFRAENDYYRKWFGYEPEVSATANTPPVTVPPTQMPNAPPPETKTKR